MFILKNLYSTETERIENTGPPYWLPQPPQRKLQLNSICYFPLNYFCAYSDTCIIISLFPIRQLFYQGKGSFYLAFILAIML